MVNYPNCPHCDNQALSVVDVEINDIRLKGIQCNNPECGKFMGFFRDYDDVLKELNDAIDEVKSNLDDLETELNRIR